MRQTVWPTVVAGTNAPNAIAVEMEDIPAGYCGKRKLFALMGHFKFFGGGKAKEECLQT